MIRSHIVNLLIYIFSVIEGYSANLYYVATNGLDSNPGTIASPFLTIAKAFTVVAAGDTIYLNTGNYSEDNSKAQTAGTAVNPIRMTSVEPYGAVLSGAAHGIFFEQAYWIINFIHFDEPVIVGRWSGSDESAESCHHMLWESNIFTGGADNKTTLSLQEDSNQYSTNGPNENTFRFNVFSNVVGHAVSVQGTSNLFWGNIFGDLKGWDAIHCFGIGNIFRSNIFDGVWTYSDGQGRSPTNSNHTDILQFFGSQTLPNPMAWGMIFEQNLITNCTGQLATIQQYAGSQIGGMMFRNNLIIYSRMDVSCYCESNQICNNDFIGCTNSDLSMIEFESDPGTKGVATGNRIFNNIFYGCGTTENNGYLSIKAGSIDTDFGHNFIADFDNSPKTGVTNSVTDINGGNPLFVNFSMDNLHLQTTSPLYAMGINFNSVFTVDYNGTIRGNYWDIGAFDSPFILSMKVLGKARFLGKATIR